MSTTDNLRDAAYIVIGLGVIGFQRAQVRREELNKQFASQRSELEARGGEAAKLLSDVVKDVRSRAGLA